MDEIQNYIKEETRKQLDELGVATKDDIEKLRKEIEELKNLLKHEK